MSTGIQTEFVPQGELGADLLLVAGRATYRQAPRLRKSLLGAISATRDGNLLVDLSAVKAMDTAAMAVLVEGLILTQDGGPELFLCGPSDSVRKIFRLAGLQGALGKCCDCREEARRLIGAGRS